MPGREDYIIRHIAMLRQLFAQMAGLRQRGLHDQALVLLFQGQEKLFGRPLAEVAGQPLDEQLALLAAGVSPEQAREKSVAYGLILREAAGIYAERDREDLATSARKAALYVLLRTAVADVEPDGELIDVLRDLLREVPADGLEAPIVELIESLGGTLGGGS